jgi:hypothetical protein
VCCWIDWLLMIKNCLIESGPPCMFPFYIQNFNEEIKSIFETEMVACTEQLTAAQLVTTFQNFMETECSVLCRHPLKLS